VLRKELGGLFLYNSYNSLTSFHGDITHAYQFILHISSFILMTSRPLRVFLCHSSNDKPAVRELYQKLRAEPWIQPWLDEEELYPGQDWNMEIEKAVEVADAIIVCLTKNSINKEGYVQREIRIALDYADYKPEGTLFIIPVRLEECTPPKRLARWQYADYFEGQRERAFQRLLTSLKKHAVSLGLRVEATVPPSMQDNVSGNILGKIEKVGISKLTSVNGKEKTESRFNTALVKIKKIFDFYSWWGRILTGFLFGSSVVLIANLFSKELSLEAIGILIIISGVSGLLTFPTKLGIIPVVMSFLTFGVAYYLIAVADFGVSKTLIGSLVVGAFYGIPLGALISRLLYWLKLIIDKWNSQKYFRS